MFRPPSKPLSCVRQCNSRYHSAMEHGSFLAVFPAPLTRPALPSQSCRHRRRSPHRVCPASSTRPAAAIRRCGRSQALPYTNELPQLLPGVRGLTTPFRSDGQTTLPCLQCRLLAPLSVRCQVAGYITALTLYDENKPHPPQSVARHPPKNACGLHSAANNSSRTP